MLIFGEYLLLITLTRKDFFLFKFFIVNTVEPTLSDLYYPNFQLSDLIPTFPTPFEPVILGFLLSIIIITPPRGLDKRCSAFYYSLKSIRVIFFS